ncbi:MFS transporter, partial [bacterium]
MTTPTASAPVTLAKPKNHLALLFGGLMVTMLLASLNQTVLSTALPTIVGELDGVSAMTWVVTGYILASTITMPIYGRISDLFGRKPVLVAAIVLFIIGSV